MQSGALQFIGVPPTGTAWTHQPKLDGYRCQIIKEGRRVALYSRNGNDWAERRCPMSSFCFRLTWGNASLPTCEVKAMTGPAIE